ncbi:C-type lectin BML-2-like [Haliotis asinina]|uniref:C-type lectin BML-2-like n=1 Tax=Haliotis asinina TaxID=109174 RepID=UPI0035325695
METISPKRTPEISFAYPFGELNNYGVPDVYGEAQMDHVSEGMLYFIWTRETCGNGYTWNIRLNLCYKLTRNLTRWYLLVTRESGGNRAADVRVKRPYSCTHIWMDGSDVQQKGTWVWSDGSSLNQHFWASSQPVVGDTIQNCIIILSHGDGNRRWHDIRCDALFPFLCQVSVPENSDC